MKIKISKCERGNTFLVNDEGDSIFWTEVDEPKDGKLQLLQVIVILENYPAINVDTIEITPEELLENIKEYNEGYYVRKWHLPFEAPVDESDCIIS